MYIEIYSHKRLLEQLHKAENLNLITKIEQQHHITYSRYIVKYVSLNDDLTHFEEKYEIFRRLKDHINTNYNLQCVLYTQVYSNGTKEIIIQFNVRY